MISIELRKEFGDILCNLSPENISHDGMLSMSATRRRVATLNAEWRRLEQRAGRAVKQDEVYKWMEAGDERQA